MNRHCEVSLPFTPHQKQDRRAAYNVKKNVVSDARLMGVAAPVEMALATSQSS
jgi:hypothetical protein